MAPRIRRGAGHEGWDQNVRSRIQTSMLLNRLRDHVVGKVELSPTQIRAAEILLKKSIPDLTATEVTHINKHANIDYSHEELVAFIGNAINGSRRIAAQEDRQGELDQLH